MSSFSRSLVVSLALSVFLTCLPSLGTAQEPPPEVHYRGGMTVVNLNFSSLHPYMEIYCPPYEECYPMLTGGGHFTTGNISAASDRMAVPGKAEAVVYSLRTREPVFRWPVKPDSFWRLSPDGKLLALASPALNLVQVLDIGSGKALWQHSMGHPCALAWSDLGEMLVALSDRFELAAWSPAAGKELFRRVLRSEKEDREEGDFEEVKGFHLMPDNNTLFYTLLYGSQKAFTWSMELETGRKMVTSISSRSNGEQAIFFSGNSRYLYKGNLYRLGDGSFTVSSVKSVKLGEVETTELVSVKTSYSPRILASRGPYVAYGYGDTLEILDVRKERAFRLKEPALYSLEFAWCRNLLVIYRGGAFYNYVTVIDPHELDK